MHKRTVTIIAALVLAISAPAARAVIDIAWAATAGFYPQGSIADDIGILDASPTGSVLVQLLINNSPAMPEPSRVFPGGVPESADDQVVMSFVISGAGYGDFSAPNFQRPFEAGWVWGRIFSSADPVVGDWYWNGPVVALEDIPPLATPQGYDLNLNTAPFPFGGDILNLPVVPEPGSIMLMALGMVGAYTIRRRRA